ncbi:hypothetical protein HCN44_009230 [Aphidius gifuensis]|uniref:Protein kinase domain-containing protein n=1 Tax=Aphidius gifuensis TaxID=684658 RepID=A0A835CVV0_APHGI|nr:calcium/calmodulin-dependent protein kinase type IV-like [Aphidius gifuensis]KAF7997832.1 hypothetical protein HCN44_009230 [Aphidius gifuensis]
MENNSSWFVDMTKGTIQNQYILGNIIGRGSTSTVHSCLHKGHKKYACKIILKAKLKQAETRSRIEMLIQIRHENIVTVREAYDDSLRVYIIEDLASGGELLERLASCGGYSERDAAKAIHDIALALEYIHSKKVIHGNLKPEKLLYATENDDSRLLLTDIGVLTSLTIPRKFIYCAPEMMSTDKPSSASDMWSLGIVLYIMLCGFEPFRNTDEIFSPDIWNDKTDEAKHLTASLLSNCPDDRPSASDLVNNSWVKGEKTAEHPMPNIVKNLREFNARRKFKAATLAVCATHRAIALSNCHEVVG